MNITGLVAEYNPFHNGHVHHLSEARRLTDADYLVVVMSGDFVQRGTPAVIDKYKRTQMALNGGADLIIELPALFATASAETFATAAVSLLHQLGCVRSLAFGAESTDLASMKMLAEFFNHEPESYRIDLKTFLRLGENYPSARANALQNYFGAEQPMDPELIEKPNNILGIEYLRAVENLRADITPVVVKRWHTDYHSDAVYENVASATALRHMLYDTDSAIERMSPYLTPYAARELAMKLHVTTPIRDDDLSMLLQYRLQSEKDRLSDYLDFDEELADRARKALPGLYSFKEWAGLLKSRAFTYTRISRALLHLVLDMKESDLAAYRSDDYCLYARILGFRKGAEPLLTEIRKNSALPMITKVADAGKVLSEKAMRLLDIDIRSADIFRNTVFTKYGTMLKDEYRTGIVKM